MDLIQEVGIIIRIQNINLLKYIAFSEGWDYLELCKKYIK